MAPLSDWLVTAVNHRLKQYKHPLLLALVLLALNTAFFVSMTFYLADGPEMVGNLVWLMEPRRPSQGLPRLTLHFSRSSKTFVKKHPSL
jgi:hypothetical protein